MKLPSILWALGFICDGDSSLRVDVIRFLEQSHCLLTIHPSISTWAALSPRRDHGKLQYLLRVCSSQDNYSGNGSPPFSPVEFPLSIQRNWYPGQVIISKYRLVVRPCGRVLRRQSNPVNLKSGIEYRDTTGLASRNLSGMWRNYARIMYLKVPKFDRGTVTVAYLFATDWNPTEGTSESHTYGPRNGTVDQVISLPVSITALHRRLRIGVFSDAHPTRVFEYRREGVWRVRSIPLLGVRRCEVDLTL